MNPEAVTIEIPLVEAIRLLELAVLAGDTTRMGVDVLNLASNDLLKTGLTPPDRDQTADLLYAVVQLNLCVNDSLVLMRPLIEAFVTAQKAALRARTNVNAMH